MEVAKDRGASPARVALAWLLDRPAVTSVIIGARTTERLADNLGAADLSLTTEELTRLEEVSRPPLLYPYWHQAKTAADRLGPADLSCSARTWPCVLRPGRPGGAAGARRRGSTAPPGRCTCSPWPG